MKLSALYQIFLDCQSVTTDSRNCPDGSLFIALKGESFNGNAFAKLALDSGCAFAIIDEIQYMDKVIMDILTTFDRKDNVLALLTNTTSGAVEILEEKTLLKKI